MGMATLHGSQIEFKGKDGVVTTFELVRVGTLKEFDTVKAALAKREQDLQAAGRENSTSLDKLQAMNVKRHDADAAYKAEKDTLKEALASMEAKLEAADKAIAADQRSHKDTAEERVRLHDLLESEKESNANSHTLIENIKQERNASNATLEKLKADLLTDTGIISSALAAMLEKLL